MAGKRGGRRRCSIRRRARCAPPGDSRRRQNAAYLRESPLRPPWRAGPGRRMPLPSTRSADRVEVGPGATPRASRGIAAGRPRPGAAGRGWRPRAPSGGSRPPLRPARRSPTAPMAGPGARRNSHADRRIARQAATPRFPCPARRSEGLNSGTRRPTKPTAQPPRGRGRIPRARPRRRRSARATAWACQSSRPRTLEA